jgi:hypothetical protein
MQKPHTMSGTRSGSLEVDMSVFAPNLDVWELRALLNSQISLTQARRQSVAVAANYSIT